MRLIELFCGIGGVAEAARQITGAQIAGATADRSLIALQPVAAIDIDSDCGDVHKFNFGGQVARRTVESLDFDRDPIFENDGNPVAWWMSPPCQPYCRRGRAAPQQDHRCAAFLSILRFLETGNPRLPHRIALENVPEFSDSSHCERLRQTLRDQGYVRWEGVLCPTEFGIPNRRRRYYLIACRDVREIAPPLLGGNARFEPDDRQTYSGSRWRFSVADILEPDPPADFTLDAAVAAAYQTALDIVDPNDPDAVTACFAGGYGKSIVRSGSYLRSEGALRRFAPREVARLLGFSDVFRFPEHVSLRRRWKMLGNSVSVPVVRTILQRMIDPGSSRF